VTVIAPARWAFEVINVAESCRAVRVFVRVLNDDVDDDGVLSDTEVEDFGL
jgi:hypothetical protein